jgi:hypothetical protein
MAFGRRTAVAGTGTGYGTGGTGGTGYGTGATGTTAGAGRGRGWGRRRRGAASTIASNKVMGGPKTKFTDMRAASGRRMSVAGAKIGEKFAHFGADVRLGFYTISHPVHPLRRAAAKERAGNLKAAATERKRQKVARAVDVEMRKRAMVREGRAARLNTAL